jgi:hypothetical protein
VMASPERKLIPGKECAVSEIQDDAYVVVEGYKHPGGGSTGLNLNQRTDAFGAPRPMSIRGHLVC